MKKENEYIELSRFWRGEIKDIMKEVNYSHLKSERSKGDNPSKYQISVLARMNKATDDYTVFTEAQSPIIVGRNQILFNVKGILRNGRFNPGYTDPEGFKNPVKVFAGKNVHKLGGVFSLESKLSEVAQDYRGAGLSRDFLKNVLDECEVYFSNVKNN